MSRFLTSRWVTLAGLAICCTVSVGWQHSSGPDLDQALLRASERNDAAAVRRLLEQGADVESKYTDGTTALMVAAQNDRTEVVRLLLDKGANVAARTPEGYTAIHAAAELAKAPTLQLLLDHGADPTVPDNDGAIPLQAAAGRGNTDAVVLFLARGATIEQKNLALLEAAHGLPIAIMEVAGGPDGNSVKRRYSEKPDPDSPAARTIRLLLQNGAEIESTSDEYGEAATPLIVAASYGETDAVNELLKNGARVDATDKDGDTPLIAAACDCVIIDMPDTYESVKLLLEKHANPNARNTAGRTALMAAVDWSRTANMQLLLDNGAAVDARDNDGNTALMNAASGGAIDKMPALKLLLQSGADVSVENDKGQTALVIARENHQDDAVRLLETAAVR